MQRQGFFSEAKRVNQHNQLKFTLIKKCDKFIENLITHLFLSFYNLQVKVIDTYHWKDITSNFLTLGFQH